ncbi:heavy metal translocating P-type ATPase [Hyphomonas johnsonii]|uniref:Heavy metal translocating P-type ATPase n=1 Tax=Hyphomonas johnsonii MHS-2 TaxID=1280950 RepID=A0A059FRY5_9PROT|nr:heavy metal translocating P-type ATPase [Hyphomonas johnsonii]KCZ93424.1 heavy metal translocating P-type ATPase [Hyphomonas johnsonii MHS-2]
MTLSLRDNEVLLASEPAGPGLRKSIYSVPGMSCAGCIAKVESGLGKLSSVTQARVNLSTKRVAVTWDEAQGVPPIQNTLSDLGFESHIQSQMVKVRDTTQSNLLRALAVSGFAAGNIMMLSVAVWSGASDTTRDLFHWISAAIAFPTLLYAGRIFYIPAFQAIRKGRVSMDVPVTIGLLLTFMMSLYDTFTHGLHAYFDAVVTLLFFLLIGRTLDHLMRQRARDVISDLERLVPDSVQVVDATGGHAFMATADILPGMTLQIALGDRFPVNVRVVSGVSDVDLSLVSGESVPKRTEPGDVIVAGALNLTGPLVVEAIAAANQSFLSQMIELIEGTEASRHAYKPIVDQVVAWYAPVVHLAAFSAFAVWYFLGAGIHHSLTVAVSVLIITCPCALGLAVPMVQVMASKRLMQQGVLMRDGAALERLNQIDTVIFDKTGTLTSGMPELVNAEQLLPAHLAIIKRMARHSRHPYSRVLADLSIVGSESGSIGNVSEHPGSGLEAVSEDGIYRFGRADWALKDQTQSIAFQGPVLSRNGEWLATLEFEHSLHSSAAPLIQTLKARGLPVEIVSGDATNAVNKIAERLQVDSACAAMLPAEKLKHIIEREADGSRVLMIGDGVNDVPAMQAAYVSMAPSSAVDIGRSAADFVFLRDDLSSVLTSLQVAQKSRALIIQNIAFALLYNLVAVPAACGGLVTPLFAAIAMSGSSIVVVANALRLSGARSGNQSFRRKRGFRKPSLMPAE